MKHSESQKPEPVQPRRPFYGWYMVAASWLLAFLVSATAVGIFFKPLLDEFGWTRARLSLVSSIIMLVFAVLSPFIGRIIDRFGPRLMLLAAAAAQALSSLVYGLAQSLPAVYLARFLWELKPTHAAQILTNYWFVRKRGRALGIISSCIPLGQLVLSPISQFLITAWGWRETFYFWGAITAVIILPLFFLIKNKPQDMGLGPDGEIAPEKNPGLVAGAAGALQNPAGMMVRETLRQPAFWLVAGTHIICGITCGLMATHLVIFATDLGYPAIIGASFLSLQGGVSLIGVLVTGALSDRIMRSRILSLTHLIRALGLWLLVVPLLLNYNNLAVLYAAVAIYGFGWFTTSPLVAGLTADLFGNARMGTLLGIILSSHMIGMAIGAYAGGIGFQLTGSYNLILAVTAGLETLACLLALAVRGPKRN
ncbi:MAG TPA: MFS transporter [Dehalococcoidales bacterium]|nr:MFS transporter [Dehalococcoidales bacterium]